MRPQIWIGHVGPLKIRSLVEAKKFYSTIGLRPVFDNDSVCIMELRGGTHLILMLDEDADAAQAEFDFMVEDLDETYGLLAEQKLTLSEITRGTIHDSFCLTDPSGNRITVNSTHVDDHNLV